jgi:phosphatidate cytidylyltransferase
VAAATAEERSVLRQRVLTALILVPLVVTGVLLLPTQWLALLLALILLVGAQEWARLAGLESCGGQVALLAALVVGLVALSWLLAAGLTPLPVLALAALWWLGTAWRIARVTRIQPAAGVDRQTAAAGLLVLLPAWLGLVWIHDLPRGPALLLFLLVLIWVADSAAYFAGRRWGRRKLAPVVSPGKTREGVYGALAGALAAGLGLAWAMAGSLASAAGLVLLCLITVVLSVVGDLYESLLKRTRGMKDSGNLLPGHGGVLDRIDSLTAAAPAFALGLALLGGAP